MMAAGESTFNWEALGLQLIPSSACRMVRFSSQRDGPALLVCLALWFNIAV